MYTIAYIDKISLERSIILLRVQHRSNKTLRAVPDLWSSSYIEVKKSLERSSSQNRRWYKIAECVSDAAVLLLVWHIEISNSLFAIFTIAIIRASKIPAVQPLSVWIPSISNYHQAAPHSEDEQ